MQQNADRIVGNLHVLGDLIVLPPFQRVQAENFGLAFGKFSRAVRNRPESSPASAC